MRDVSISDAFNIAAAAKSAILQDNSEDVVCRHLGELLSQVNKAVEQVNRLRAERDELVSALKELVDWHPELWRVFSDHPNDRNCREEFHKDVSSARAVLDKIRGVRT